MRLCLQKLGHNFVYIIIVKEQKTELICKAVHNLNSDLFVNTIGRKMVNMSQNGDVSCVNLGFFSVRLLSVLCGHSVFSSPPQRPMNSDFEGFLYQILSITLFS